VRHLAVGQACPMDGATVTRSHCSGCPSFVSFRMTDERAAVGCDWGEDVAQWLRRAMHAEGGPTPDRAEGRVSAGAPGARTVAPVRGGQPFRTGASIGFFLAAFGLGIALSGWERPS
jgi:hypothetical protein